MGNLTANKVMRKTFEHLAQMVDEKNGKDQKARDECKDADLVTENNMYDRQRREPAN